MRKGLIPLDFEAAIEPVVSIVLITAPWIFGFSDVQSATAISIIIGAVKLFTALATRWDPADAHDREYRAFANVAAAR